MKPLQTAILALTSLLLVATVHAETDNGEEQLPETPGPEELATSSDVVVLAQLRHLDYEFRREIPVGGAAWFNVLIPYKVPAPMEQLRVHEEGLRDDECYFERAEGWHEEPRFLLFLVTDEEGDFRGNPGGCALHVLTTADSRYVIRWPQENLHLDEEGMEAVDTFEFVGPGARRSTEGMTSIRIEALQEEAAMREEEDALVYTRGIELGRFRQLMGDGLIPEERTQRRAR